MPDPVDSACLLEPLRLRDFGGVFRRWFKVVWRGGMALRGKRPSESSAPLVGAVLKPDRGAAARR